MTNSSIHPTEFSRLIALCLIFLLAFSSFYLWLPETYLNVPEDSSTFPYQYWETLILKVAVAWLLITFIASGLYYRSGYLSVINGALLGLSFFVLLIGLRVVDPAHIGWLVKDDLQWHFLGWHFFRQEPWQVPPGAISDFLHPIGTSVGYTDSIPIIALLLKPFHNALPADFQYLGAWLLVCFVLQGIFGVLLMRVWTTNLVLQNLGALFFIVAPILLNRYGHVALMSHWLLLAGLWLYFRPWPSSRWFAPLWGWLILIGLSAGIHPYLAVMMIAMGVAFYLKFWLVDCKGKLIAFAASLVQLFCLALATVMMTWAAGYLLVMEPNSLVTQGLGYYSMNLLAPFNPMGWSMWFKDIPLATTGQYEGFSYFGLGIFLLAALSVYLMLRQFPKGEWWATVFPILLVAILFTLFALSPQITWASRVLYTVEHEWLDILGTFHSSGRFFWVMYYLVIFMVMGMIIQRHSGWIAGIVLSVALGIQLLDFHPQHRAHWTNFHTNATWHSWEPEVDLAAWQTWTQDAQHLVKIPSRFCGEPAAPFFPFAYYAASHGLTINTAYVARYDVAAMEAYCQQLHTRLDTGEVKTDTVYLIGAEFVERFKANAQKPLTCQQITGIETCKVALSN